ncbi:MAG: D-alanine--D-alanine ligase, partial [Bacilli bacterium]
MSEKIRVAILFGGKSGEHLVSIQSASSVIEAIDTNEYDIVPICIDSRGHWLSIEQSIPLLNESTSNKLRLVSSNQSTISVEEKDQSSLLPSVAPSLASANIDVVFPVLHGTYGEDGTIQGLLEMANVPYVGAGVLSSAVGMDKVFTKRVFDQMELPQGNYLSYLRSQWDHEANEVLVEIESRFSYPVFVKPSNSGSSVGISKAKNQDELIEAIHLACQYDRKFLVEENIKGREIEVAILGNEDPIASVPGEIVSSNDFYDYRAKYVDGKSAMVIPAELPSEHSELIRELAIKAYKAIDASGLARVDFFYTEEGRILINEINTMPGFTKYSMYANLWAGTGLTYSQLVEKLIRLALERYEDKQRT